jgi:hypothetical protein
MNRLELLLRIGDLEMQAFTHVGHPDPALLS